MSYYVCVMRNLNINKKGDSMLRYIGQQKMSINKQGYFLNRILKPKIGKPGDLFYVYEDVENKIYVIKHVGATPDPDYVKSDIPGYERDGE